MGVVKPHSSHEDELEPVSTAEDWSSCSTVETRVSPPIDLSALLKDPQRHPVKICAPMVRYSRRPFRELVRQYGCDLAYTPMIMAEAVIKSEKGRHHELLSDLGDRPLVVQFAARHSEELAEAAVIAYCHGVDGVDLNCGCPQSWAIREGYGAALLMEPELVRDMVHLTRNRLPGSFSTSIKIRILSDIQKSVEFCREMEAAGVSFITVHGRTARERSEPVQLDAIRTIRDALNIPVIANGDMTCMDDVFEVVEATGVHGVMAARGLMRNPGLYAGHAVTPLACIKDWTDGYMQKNNLPFSVFHHQLACMCEKLLSKAQRKALNTLNDIQGVTSFLIDQFGMEFPQSTEEGI